MVPKSSIVYLSDQPGQSGLLIVKIKDIKWKITGCMKIELES